MILLRSLLIATLKRKTSIRARAQRLLSIFVSCSLFLSPTTSAKSINLEASWGADIFHNSGAVDDDDINRFRQRYYARWAPHVTQAMSLSSSIDYNNTHTTGQQTHEIVTPSFNFDIINDIFNAALNGYLTNTNSSDRVNNRTGSLEASLRSSWKYDLWPHVRLRYGKRFEDDGGAHTDLDRQSRWGEFALDWAYSQFKTYYSYLKTYNDDLMKDSNSEQDRHVGRVEYFNTFWKNRLQLGFSHQARLNATKYEIRDDSLDIKVPVSQALSGSDPTPEFGSLPSNGALIDENRDLIAYTVTMNDPANLALKTDFQRVDAIYVYTPVDPGVIPSHMLSIKWDIYMSSDGVNWQREVINASTTYDLDKNRYEVQTGGLQGIYLKLVVTDWMPIGVVNITEVESYENVTGDNLLRERTNNNYTTDFNMSFIPVENTFLTYFLTWNKGDNSDGNDIDRFTHTASFAWNYSRYFNPSFTFTNSIIDNSQISDRETRGYSLSIQSSPLNTYETTLGLSRYEAFEDNTRENTNHTLSWSNSAILYPRLTTELDVNFHFNRNDEQETEGTNTSANWRITSRIRDNLTVDFMADYGINTVDRVTDEDDVDTNGGRSSLNINWRPSELISVSSVGTVGYGDNAEQFNSFLMNTTVTVMRTGKSLGTVGYSFNVNENDTINTFNFTWSWNLSEYITFNANTNYLIRDEMNSWNAIFRLSTKF